MYVAHDHTGGYEGGAVMGHHWGQAKAEVNKLNPEVREGFLEEKGICKMGR